MSQIIHIKQEVENYLLNAPRQIMFRENIWFTWASDIVTFDKDCYGIQGLFDVYSRGKEKMLGIFTDTAIEYYSDGSRKIVTQPIEMLLNDDFVHWKQAKEYSSSFLVDEDHIRNLFPEQTEYFDKLNKKYPECKGSWRFHVLHDTSKFRLAMNVEANGFKCRFGNYNEILNYSNLSGLKKFFNAMGVVCQKNGTLALENMKEQRTYYVSYGSKKSKIHISVGYAKLPYNVANSVIVDEDKPELRKLYCKGHELFDVSVNGRLIGISPVDKFDSKFGAICGNITLLPQNFTKWGEEFSQEELNTIQRERYFKYVNPDMGTLTRSFKRMFAC